MSQIAGTTFRFCEALAMVGVSVIDSSGSIISAKVAPMPRAVWSTAFGDSGFEPVMSSTAASTSGMSRRSGR